MFVLPGPIPIASPECAFHCSSRVAALVGNGANGVFLFERVARRKRPEPPARARQGRTPLAYVVTRRYVSEKLAGAPADRAICLIEQGKERSDAMFADKGIGILRFTKKARLENTKRGRVSRIIS